MNGLGTRVGLAEPAPAALYRAGAFYRNARARLEAERAVLPRPAAGDRRAGRRRSAAVLAHLRPVPGDETAAILAAYSTLWMLGRHSRITLPIDTVIVHGRPELALTQDPEAFRQRTGARLIRAPEPDYDSTAAALGVALANPLADETRTRPGAHAQAAGLHPRHLPLGRARPPRRLLGAVSLFLIGRPPRPPLDSRPSARQTAAPSLAQGPGPGQARRREEGSSRNGSRSWRRSGATAGGLVGGSCGPSPADAPENTTIITSLGRRRVRAGLEEGGTTKAKKQLIVNFATPMSEDGSMPREIDGFLATSRGEPTLKRHFPFIEVSGLRTGSTRQPASAGGWPRTASSACPRPSRPSGGHR